MRVLNKSLKYIFIFSVVFLFSLNSCFAKEQILVNERTYQQDMNAAGFRILNANNIEKRIMFQYNPKDKVKGKTQNRIKRVVLYKGMVASIDNSDELAAALSIQIAYLNDIHKGIFKRMAMSYSPRKYEFKSDRKAVDLMVNAGYDPVALINLINKTEFEPRRYESNLFKHTGKERMVNIYDYIYEKYPIYLADNKYLGNPYYQNFLLNTKKERERTKLIREYKLKKNK